MTRLVARIGGVVAAVITAASAVGGQRPDAPSIPVVVELFTSEGCSSCPPADALLMDLVEKQPVKGVFIIGISEHVTYFNSQAWQDPFSNAGFTARQSAYGKALALPDIYTPQVVIDGSRELVGQDRSGVLAGIRQAAAAAKGVLHLSWAGRSTAVGADVSPPELEIDLERHAKSARAQVFLAIVEDGLSSAVNGGENKGRTLVHAAVARRLVEIGRTDRDGAFHRTVPIDLPRPWKIPPARVIVFVQSPGAGRISAAGVIGITHQ